MLQTKQAHVFIGLKNHQNQQQSSRKLPTEGKSTKDTEKKEEENFKTSRAKQVKRRKINTKLTPSEEKLLQSFKGRSVESFKSYKKT